MKVIDNYDQERQYTNIVVTFGNFDGVHLGHQYILSTLKKISRDKGLPSGVLTFEPHPATILFNRKDFRIMNQEQKENLISHYDIDYLYIIHFTKVFSQIKYQDFLSEILIKRYHAQHIIVGEDCTFGHKKLGNILALKQYMKNHEYSLNILPPLIMNQEICSSSLIRNYIRIGEIDIANKLLGRPYQISGIVMKGACRGRIIGFPTINIAIQEEMIKPKFGTYYAKVIYCNHSLYGVVNVGMRPTCQDLTAPIIEMHILDFNQNIYNDTVYIQFLKFIRSEKKFSALDQLIQQIQDDIIKVRQLKSYIA
ncbi:riboflavin biosynthesis protein RibF [Wolbachia endosymbiont of Howardula sp.]|uniref:riboflavin biosynthesis protein RibF n=1 Tax=Wolbachia endosymbiont of Howardula sp. TaxID=2916816 RepID=UPI00217D7DB8|nr:riboflavin biosynthesis protein RibF [Wolbachia endosymbiont of Howardula sp.]UWI83346.1 riboflavin biosynthesis protein RibF [Wolbachia endosymbiont of Howardula sp.]